MNTNGLGFVNWKHARDVLVYNYKSSQTIWKKWLDSCRASLTLWKIYNARSNKLNLTTTQKQKSCSIHLCPLNPSCRQWKGRCWFTCHSFEYNKMMSYFPGGWHSMTHSVPQMVLAMIQLSVAGQHAWANKTSYTLQSLFSYGKNQQSPHWTWFFFLPNDFCDFVCIFVLTNQRQNSYVVGTGLLELVSPSMKHQFNQKYCKKQK